MPARREVLHAGLATAACLAGPAGSAATRDLPDEVTALTLRQASTALRRGSVSPVDLTRACLDRIGSRDPALNSFITGLKPACGLVSARGVPGCSL